MRMVVIFCGGAPGGKHDYFSVSFDDTFAQRFIRNLVNDPEYCAGCGALCDHCRDTCGIDFSGELVDILQMPSPLPFYLDDSAAMLGGELRPHEVTVAINIHEEMLLVLPEMAARAGSRALIVPSEAPGWSSGWVRIQVKNSCRKLDMACDFPKPFCSMRRGRYPYLDAVMDHFHIGRPEMKLEVSNGLIREARVITSAPCGNTYFVAFNLKGAPADEGAVEYVAKYWHSFPCVASMEMDREAGDTILHLGGYLHYEALRAALEAEGITITVPTPKYPL